MTASRRLGVATHSALRSSSASTSPVLDDRPDPSWPRIRRVPRQPPTYIQRLPALGLSIQKNTPEVAPDGRFYLLRDGEVLGRYRSLPAAKNAWQEVLDAAGWQPPNRTELSAEEKLE